MPSSSAYGPPEPVATGEGSLATAEKAATPPAAAKDAAVPAGPPTPVSGWRTAFSWNSPEPLKALGAIGTALPGKLLLIKRSRAGSGNALTLFPSWSRPTAPFE